MDVEREVARRALDLCQEQGVGEQVPNTIVEVGVCRPGWLVEVEGLAILRGARA